MSKLTQEGIAVRAKWSQAKLKLAHHVIGCNECKAARESGDESAARHGWDPDCAKAAELADVMDHYYLAAEELGAFS